jgi:predicted permease
LRASRRNLVTAFRESARTGSGSGRRAFGALLVIELTLAAALVGIAATLGLAFVHLQARDVGFQTADLLTFHVELQAARFSTPGARRALIDQLQTRLLQVPGAAAVGISTVNPLCCGDWGAPFALEGADVTAASANRTNWRLVTPEFFRAIGVRLVDGRLFDDRDVAGAEPVSIVDERFARRYWPEGSAVGHRLKRGWTGADYPWSRIVGVVSAVEDAGDYTDTWYLPYGQNPLAPSSDELHVWIRGRDAEASAAQVRDVVRDLDRALPVYRLSSMDAIKNEELAQRRVGTGVAAGFAIAGTALALSGVYAIVAFVVTREERDMGLRLALGATGSRVFRQVVGRMIRLSMVGVGAGVLVVYMLERQLAAALGTAPEPYWPVALVVAAGLFVAVASAAAVPARRILSIDPARILTGA